MSQRGDVRLIGGELAAAGRHPAPDGDGNDPAALKERLRKAGRALGFHRIGFAPAETPTHADFYREWLRRGWHGEMGYLAREDAVRRRVSPAEALPGCRSILVAVLSYATEDADGPPFEAGDVLAPVVARYARGADYHGVFEARLGRLAETVEALAPGTRTLPYVDYGPVLERDHAQRAGLGWIGKNTVLIDPALGSYLLLGELLTTLEVPPDEPFAPDRCGTCTRCIEACPTDAIRAGRELDARRCISYLTIELRGSIPRELRPAIGSRIFGCDICQEVCPWNRDAPVPEESPLRPAEEAERGNSKGKPGKGAPPAESRGSAWEPGKPAIPASMAAWAEELLDLEDDEFRARYRDTPFDRPKRAGLLRNLCVGLGNAGRPEAVPVLVRALEDREALVRGHAAWALGEIGTKEARSTLSDRIGTEPDPDVREELRLAGR